MIRFGLLSTYAPTRCALASFSAALAKHLTAAGNGYSVGVVRVVDAPPFEWHEGVVAHLLNRAPNGAAVAAAALNRFDVAILQHDFEIYGGPDGQDVLRVLDALRVPAVVVLHAVPAAPTARQRRILERLVTAAGTAVVTSHTARHRLSTTYRVDPAKVTVIPHGALTPRRANPVPALNPFSAVAAGRRPTILTWGLLGPGKGVEAGIDAVAALPVLATAPRYLVAGPTHPRMLTHDGDAWRDRLRARVERTGLGGTVEFDERYRSAQTLMDLVGRADVVLLPYESTEQAASAVLAEAVAAGRPVVATDFPHARELLSGGAGIVVPHGDTAAMSAALHSVLTDRVLAVSMAANAHRVAADLRWPTVAAAYARAGEQLLARRVELAA